MVGRTVSFWDRLFSGSLFVYQGVNPCFSVSTSPIPGADTSIFFAFRRTFSPEFNGDVFEMKPVGAVQFVVFFSISMTWLRLNQININMIFLWSGFFWKTNLHIFLLLNMVECHFVDMADHALLFLSNMGTENCRGTRKFHSCLNPLLTFDLTQTKRPAWLMLWHQHFQLLSFWDKEKHGPKIIQPTPSCNLKKSTQGTQHQQYSTAPWEISAAVMRIHLHGRWIRMLLVEIHRFVDAESTKPFGSQNPQLAMELNKSGPPLGGSSHLEGLTITMVINHLHPMGWSSKQFFRSFYLFSCFFFFGQQKFRWLVPQNNQWERAFPKDFSLLFCHATWAMER